MRAERSVTNGRFSVVNDKFLMFLELPKEQVLGKLYSEFAQVDPYSDDYKNFWSTLREGKSQTNMEAYKLFSGKEVWLQQTFTPIINSELSLNLLIDHFKEKKADKKYLPCRVGLRNLFIKPNGDSMLCWKFPDCGNVVRDGASGIWLSKTTKKIRKQTVGCQRLCLLTCTSQKTLVGRLKMAAVLFGSNIKNQK